jgi:RNA polymerase sigma factor (sigma-70 family)
MTTSPYEFKDLLAKVREGSPEAGQKLYHQFGNHILRVVRKHLPLKLRPKFDSLDFEQDVWASFFAADPRDQKFESPSALAAYLAKMAANKVAEVSRTRLQRRKYNVNRENSLEGSAAFQVEHLIGPDPTPSQTAAAKEALSRLTTGQSDIRRKILELLQQGHDHAEIAAALNVNEKTIRRMIRQLKEPKA